MAHDDEWIPLPREAITPLADALSDESVDVALNAAYTLELLGRASAAGHADDRLRLAASEAISSIEVGSR